MIIQLMSCKNFPNTVSVVHFLTLQTLNKSNIPCAYKNHCTVPTIIPSSSLQRQRSTFQVVSNFVLKIRNFLFISIRWLCRSPHTLSYACMLFARQWNLFFNASLCNLTIPASRRQKHYHPQVFFYLYASLKSGVILTNYFIVFVTSANVVKKILKTICNYTGSDVHLFKLCSTLHSLRPFAIFV